MPKKQGTRRRVACAKCRRSAELLGEADMEAIGWRKMEPKRWWCPFCTGITAPLNRILHKECAPNLFVGGLAWAPVSPTVPSCVMDSPGAYLRIVRQSDGQCILKVPLKKVPLFFPLAPEFLDLPVPVKLENVRLDLPGWATLVWRRA